MQKKLKHAFLLLNRGYTKPLVTGKNLRFFFLLPNQFIKRTIEYPDYGFF